MINVLISLISSILMLIVFVSLVRVYKKDHHINIFFLLILLVTSIPRLFYSLSILGVVSNHIQNAIDNNIKFSYIVIFLFLMFYRKSLQLKIWTQTTYLITAFVVVMFILNFITRIDKIQQAIYYLICISLGYVSILFWVYQRFIGTNKKPYKLAFKRWIGIMLIATFFLMLSIFIVIFKSKGEAQFPILQTHFNISSVVWTIISIYILSNPLLLFGEENLKEKIVKATVINQTIWKTGMLITVEEVDKKLSEIISPKTNEYLHQINKLNFGTKVFLNSKPVDFIALKLKIPKSHIKYLFKYHCIYSVHEFLNYHRILAAKRLIDQGYLESKTVLSLASEVGYKSKMPFYDNFKKYTGTNVSGYKEGVH